MPIGASLPINSGVPLQVSSGLTSY